jgi:hypothetical protein
MQPWSPSRARAARYGCLAAALAATVAAAAEAGEAPVWPEPNGTLVLARPFGRSDLSLRLARRVAGAVDSLTWDGVTFIADTEAEDALQARVTVGPGEAGRAASEGGGPEDGVPAAQRLTGLRFGRSWAETETRLAWTPPGARDVILHKRVGLGLPGLGNAVEVQARFVLPEPADAVRFEALAASVPAEFSEAWSFDRGTGTVSRLDPADGDQQRPVILAMPEGSHALAFWSPNPPAQEADAPRPAFAVRPGADTTRLSCAFAVAHAASGAHEFACYALVGTLADIRAALRSLTAPE